MPRTRFNEAISFITGGLQDVSLSRSQLTWGVPVPWDEDQVFYVWFDALLNYYTALSFARPGDDLTSEFWPATFHLIGKDILKFHTVFWPAMLMAADLPLPEHVFVHGFLLMDGEKMSKSLGNVLDPFEVMERFGTDALRYYCCPRGHPSGRTARCRPPASRPATRASWPTSTATSPAGRWRWSPATATAWSPTRRPTPGRRPTSTASPTASARCSTAPT